MRAAPPPTLRACDSTGIDSDSLDAAFRRHVEAGHVDYPGLARDRDFARFLADIPRAERGTATRNEWLAFLINAYNALAVRSVIDDFSPSRLAGRLRFFLLRRHRIAGRRLTLYGLERRHLMPMGEPRIHFAIVCASASCPRLRAAAYRPETLGPLLDADAREFVNDTGVAHRLAARAFRVEFLPYDWSLNGTRP